MDSRLPVLVLRAAGINCDEETMHCWRLAGAAPRLTHVNEVVENPGILHQFKIVTIPGGFSYGDDIAAGVILAQRIHLSLAEPLREFVERGGGVFGICNGFQVLVKMGLLPGVSFGRNCLTVTYNESAKFEARWVRLQVATSRCPFLVQLHQDATSVNGLRMLRQRPRRNASSSCYASASSNPVPVNSSARVSDKTLRVIELPVEHAEGRVVTASDLVTEQLLACGQVALRYVDPVGRTDPYPYNPNGSSGGIAGLCDPTGRVFGLMPHPDRFFDRMHHPQWSSRDSAEHPHGLKIFENAVAYWR